VEELRRERDQIEQGGLPIADLAGSVMHSMRLAEEAMDSEALPDRRFVIADLEMTLRTLVRVEQQQLLMTLPHLAAPIAPETYSTLTMRLAPVPVALLPEHPAAAAFAAQLESLQEGFLGWNAPAGTNEARAALDSLTQLLSIRQRWGSASVAGEIQALGDSLAIIGKAIARLPPINVRRAYRRHVADFQAVAATLDARAPATPEAFQAWPSSRAAPD
jgi:hypothetical protein